MLKAIAVIRPSAAESIISWRSDVATIGRCGGGFLSMGIVVEE
jgi:hypothetical protein